MADVELNSDALFKNFYRCLLDSVISRNEMEEIDTTKKGLADSLNQDISSVDELKGRIFKELDSFSALDHVSRFEDASNEMKSLITLTMEKFKAKTQDDFKSKKEDLDVTYSSAKTNAIKNIQALLSSGLLKVLDSNVSTRWTDGTYDSTSRYKVEGGIEFEFSLKSTSVDLLKELLKFSTLEKGVKLPIDSATNWTGKDAQMDMEKIDKYTLLSANLNKGNLFAVFADPDSEAKFNFVMSRGGDGSFLSIEYKNEDKTVDITGNSALNNMVELDKIQRPLDMIYGTLKELEANKTKLSSLSMGGKDILVSSSYHSLALKITESWANEIKASLETLPDKGDGDQISMASLKEKLKFCGETGITIGNFIGVTP
jgi:hypothetical protein